MKDSMQETQWNKTKLTGSSHYRKCAHSRVVGVRGFRQRGVDIAGCGNGGAGRMWKNKEVLTRMGMAIVEPRRGRRRRGDQEKGEAGQWWLWWCWWIVRNLLRHLTTTNIINQAKTKIKKKNTLCDLLERFKMIDDVRHRFGYWIGYHNHTDDADMRTKDLWLRYLWLY